VLVYNVFPGESAPDPFQKHHALTHQILLGAMLNFLILLKGK